MTTGPLTHDTLSYRNDFENAIFTSTSPTQAMSTSKSLHDDPALQSFTATGRPISKTSESTKGSGLDGLTSAEAYGAGAPNLLPVRFTDQSIISVPVLPFPSPDLADDRPAPPDSTSDSDDNPIKGLDWEPKPKSKSKTRFSLSSFRHRRGSKKDTKQPAFVMKDMTRAEYLKHYAKDDDGRYIGTEEPGSDCILSRTEDITKYKKRPPFTSGNEDPRKQMELRETASFGLAGT